jgi:hypothetical protein
MKNEPLVDQPAFIQFMNAEIPRKALELIESTVDQRTERLTESTSENEEHFFVPFESQRIFTKISFYKTSFPKVQKFINVSLRGCSQKASVETGLGLNDVSFFSSETVWFFVVSFVILAQLGMKPWLNPPDLVPEHPQNSISLLNTPNRFSWKKFSQQSLRLTVFRQHKKLLRVKAFLHSSIDLQRFSLCL